jgi:hypothetical protein
MILRARSCAAALVTVGLALYTESARADAAAPVAPTCTVALSSSPKAAITLPANAPALLVVDRSSQSTSPTLQAALANGSTRTALPVATDTHGLWTLALPSPNAALGKYDVEVKSSCPDISDERDLVTPLTLTTAVPFPTSVGTLVHVPSDPPSGVDWVRLDPTPNMAAFLAAAQLELVVDGARTAKITFVSAVSPINLTINTGEACIENGALHRDKRIVKVTLEGAIAGVAEAPAPASIDVPVDCGAIKWTSGLNLDPDDDTNPPTSSNGATSPSPTSSSSSGGCSASPAGPHGGVPSFLALAIGALALSASRAARRGSSRR